MSTDYYDTEAVRCEKPKRGGSKNNYFLRCYYEFDPGEKEETYYPDGSGYPGSSPDVNIYKISMCFGSYESQCVLHLLEEIADRFEVEELESTILKELTE